MWKQMYQRIPLVNRLPLWVTTLIAALTFIGVGVGQAVISGESTPTVEQAIVVGTTQSVAPGITTSLVASSSLSAATAASVTQIKVAAVTGFRTGDLIVIDTGTNAEVRKISALSATARTFNLDSPLLFAHSSGVLVATLEKPTPASTTLSEATTAAVTQISVASVTGFRSGQTVIVDTEADAEERTITAVDTTNRVLTLDSGLLIAHSIGDSVISKGKTPTDVTSPGITSEKGTKFQVAFTIFQGEKADVQLALLNRSNQRAVARIEVGGVPRGITLSADTLAKASVTKVVPASPTAFLLEMEALQLDEKNLNFKLTVQAADDAPVGAIPLTIRIQQIPN